MNAPGATAAPSRPILVVDDEEIVLAALKETLRRARYDVVTMSDPVSALEELKKTEFSVIITDQSMPTLSGLELLAQARQFQPYATRILITAVLSLDMVIDSINKGEIYRFIVKPWLREEFLATVKNAVQRYELICQNAYLQETTQTMNEQLVELNRSLEQQVKLVAQQNQQLAEANLALETSLLRSLELCVHTMQTFYPALGDQARKASRICSSIARVLGLSAEERRVLESSALLHDIGLVGVPRQIIRRWQEDPNTLGPAEKALIEQHPVLGQEMTAFGAEFDKVGEVIRAHHERFDGSGYPDKLAGEEIPWLGRLLAIAVAYASTGEKGSDALDRIKIAAGSAFDPEAVRVFLRALTEADSPRREREIGLTDLQPGMVLARGIYAPNGLLLAPEGQHLSVTLIEKLLNHNRIQPIEQTLTVYC
jgi:response regulator RpfG family c-di-GMP phosphodiesterase